MNLFFKIGGCSLSVTLFLLLFCRELLAAPVAADNEMATDILIDSAPLPESMNAYAGSATIYRPDSPLNPTKTEFQDIIQLSPNTTWAGGTAAPRFLQIRGIGELEQYEGAPNPSVGLIIDDLDLSGLGLPMTLFDLEKVEILRGPQATRFGANGLAGIVSLKTAQPTSYSSARGLLSTGNDELFSSGLAFGDSVMNSDQLSYRLTLGHEQSNGFRKNLYNNKDNTNGRQNSDSRLQLRYEPSSDTQFDLEGLFARQNDGYDAFALNNAFTAQSDRPGKDDHNLAGGKFVASHSFYPDLKAISTSSLSSSDLAYGFDGDWGNNPFWGVNAPYDYRSASSRERDVFSQEFRLESLKEERDSWLIGLFGQHLDENSRIEEFSNEEKYRDLSTDYRADTLAAFAAIEKPLDAKFSVGSSLRVEQRDTAYEDSNFQSFNPDFNMQGGSAYLKYKISQSDQIYTLVSRGFKGGGFNAGTRVPAELTEYNPESLWNYEIGTKGAALSDSLVYGVSAFWMQRYDQQIKLALQDNPEDPLSFTYLTDNAARGRNLGLEANAEAELSQFWQLRGSAGLLNTEITSADPALPELDGRQQSSAPPWNFAIQARYLLSDNWYVSSTLTGQDSFYFDDSHNQKSSAYALLGAELGWIKNNLKISLWGKNLTNEDYAIRGFYFGIEPPEFSNATYIQRGDPCSYGITVSYLY